MQVGRKLCSWYLSRSISFFSSEKSAPAYGEMRRLLNGSLDFFLAEWRLIMQLLFWRGPSYPLNRSIPIDYRAEGLITARWQMRNLQIPQSYLPTPYHNPRHLSHQYLLCLHLQKKPNHWKRKPRERSNCWGNRPIFITDILYSDHENIAVIVWSVGSR